MQIEPIHWLRGREQNAQLQLCVPPVVTRWRCHRKTVAGVTRRRPRSTAGRRWIRAANMARSAKIKTGLGVGSAEYGDLVAENEELDVLGR